PDRRNQVGHLLFDRAAGPREVALLQRVKLAVAVERKPADSLDKFLKYLVACDEIGLGVDFDNGTNGTAGRDPDQTLCRDSSCPLPARRKALLSQPVTRRLNIPATVAERPFAVHHSRAGLLAQLFDQRCRNLGHNMTLSSEPR